LKREKIKFRKEKIKVRNRERKASAQRKEDHENTIINKRFRSKKINDVSISDNFPYRTTRKTSGNFN
jgi:hypothetical protein